MESNSSTTTTTMKPTDDYSLMNKKLDPTSSFWMKKYTLLLKKTENVEKQNLRLLNRLYHIQSITKRRIKEKRFLMKRLDKHNDDYKKVKFYRGAALSDFLHEPENSNCPPTKTTRPLVSSKSAAKLKAKRSSPLQSSRTNSKPQKPPKKPLNAFLWYCHEQRDILLHKHPDMNHQELTKVMSRCWNTLDEADKEMYYEMFDADRARYDQEMEVYRLQHPNAQQQQQKNSKKKLLKRKQKHSAVKKKKHSATSTTATTTVAQLQSTTTATAETTTATTNTSSEKLSSSLAVDL